jgi:5-methylcytosine-specific restriction endonuclease McrA
MQAVDAHLRGERTSADALIRLADLPAITAWTESIWGRASEEIHGFLSVDGSPPYLPLEGRPFPRMPTSSQKAEILARDGYHCRFCGIPVISPTVRMKFQSLYPEATRWGRKNTEQHAAFQCMWLQFDHILPNQRGGSSDPDNVVITCAPCNFGRMEWTCAEARLMDPRSRSLCPSWTGHSRWNGLSGML